MRSGGGNPAVLTLSREGGYLGLITIGVA